MTFTKRKRKSGQTKAKLGSCLLVKLVRTVSVSGLLLLIALLCVHCHTNAEGVLVQSPINKTVLVNDSTFFNCSKSSNNSIEPVWYHHPLTDAQSLTDTKHGVYEYERIKNKYKDRFGIDKNLTSGTFNLLVEKPQPSDAGRYECVEDFGKDTGPSAELTVLDSNLVCESNKNLSDIVGPTECDKRIEPDEIQLTCSVTYSGNIPPQLEWKRVGNELELNVTKCDVRGNRVMCNATLEVGPNLDGAVYVCQVKSAEQYNCSRKVNKTIYTVSDTTVRAITTTGEAFCSANTSVGLSCSYKWYKDNQTEELDQTLKPSMPGKYRCEAVCRIRNENCSFTAMKIIASESGTWNKKYLGLLALIVPVLAAPLLLYFLCKKCRKAKTKENPAALEEIELLVPNENNKTGEAIQAAFKQARPIRRTLSGNIHGPGFYTLENVQCECAYEEVECLKASEEETSKLMTTVFNNGMKWKALKHDNLIKYHDVVAHSPAIYIVMEYARVDSVREALDKRRTDLPIDVVRDWAIQIAEGLKYLHDNKIVHKGFETAHIIIVESSEKYTPYTLKIASFNLFDDDTVNDGSSVANKAAYYPPAEGGNDSYSHDVWRYGIVIWEILTRNVPYKGMSNLKIAKDIQKGAKKLKIPISCPKTLKQIIKGCRIVKSSRRPSSSTVLLRLKEWQLSDNGDSNSTRCSTLC